jgi:predicted lipoprotein
MTTSRRNQIIGWASAFGIIAVVSWLMPLFHIVPLHSPQHSSAGAAFDPEVVVEKLWREQLQKPDLQTLDAVRLVKLLREKSPAAAELGRRLGLSRTTCYLLAGTGRIVSVTNDSVLIALEGNANEPCVAIETGPVFGNAIRDGSGLMDVSAFPNSQDFNAISTALNRRVEEQVLPQLRAKAGAGVRVRFVGGAEVDDLTSALPLRVVPIRIEWP